MTIRKIFVPLSLVAVLAAGISARAQTPAPPAAPPAAAPGNHSFTIVAGDDSADVTELTVKKGDMVNITFKIDAANTYHAGLEFRSAKVETGAIRPGESKMVSFVADATFSLVPYWPSSNRKKPYTVKVTVQP